MLEINTHTARLSIFNKRNNRIDSCSRGHVIGSRIVMHTDTTNVINPGRGSGKG